MLPMSFYLGIDAGGTKTVCILGDESRTLARATGGSIKHMRVGEETGGAEPSAGGEGSS